jgi:hypothetical protein
MNQNINELPGFGVTGFTGCPRTKDLNIRVKRITVRHENKPRHSTIIAISTKK